MQLCTLHFLSCCANLILADEVPSTVVDSVSYVALPRCSLPVTLGTLGTLGVCSWLLSCHSNQHIIRNQNDARRLDNSTHTAGPGAVGVARNAFAVFMQPDVTAPMDAPEGGAAATSFIIDLKAESCYQGLANLCVDMGPKFYK